jgi:hypothetical protein
VSVSVCAHVGIYRSRRRKSVRRKRGERMIITSKTKNVILRKIVK